MEEAEVLRKRMHDLADKLGGVVTRVEVSAVQLEAAIGRIARIETELESTKMAVLIMQTRADAASKAASHAGAKWGGIVGGLLGGAAWVWSILGGK